MNTATATLRVRKTLYVGSAAPQTTTFWEGSDIAELSKAYPPSQVLFADPLGHSELEGGHIRTDYTFERYVNGMWIEIDDPRVRLTPLTATEMAIDAINRHQFPGDYLDEEEEFDPYGDDLDPHPGYDESDYVICRVCDDEGCALCNPSWLDENSPEPIFCTNCNDHGCDLCAPDEDFCINCRRPFYSHQLTNEICAGCTSELQRVCASCGHHHGDTQLKQGDLCRNCERMYFWQQFQPANLMWRLRCLGRKIFRLRK